MVREAGEAQTPLGGTDVEQGIRVGGGEEEESTECVVERHIQRQEIVGGPWIGCLCHRVDGRHESRGVGHPLVPEDGGRLSEMAFSEE